MMADKKQDRVGLMIGGCKGTLWRRGWYIYEKGYGGLYDC